MNLGLLSLLDAKRRLKRRPNPPRFISPLMPANLPLSRCPFSREQASKRIIILRLGAFGDILMGTPLLAALRRAYPEAHLTWIVDEMAREAIDANPFIDEILIFDGVYWKRMIRTLNYLSWVVWVLSFRNRLQSRRYDVFVSFQPEEWPLLTLGIHAQVAIGIFDTFKRFYGKSHNSHFRRFYTHCYSAPELATHRTNQYLLTLRALKLTPVSDEPMTIGYTEADQTAADDFLAQHGLGENREFIVLAPLTTWPTRCWPDDYYVELADALVDRYGWPIVIIGSDKERMQLEKIASRFKIPPILMAGELSFRQTAALLGRARLLISGDTGPMHVASALSLPQVALFGPTSPDWYGPRSGQALVMAKSVPCGPCDQKFCRNMSDPHLCMTSLGVNEVLAAVNNLLKREIFV